MGNGYVQADGSAFQTMRDVITYSIAQVTLSEHLLTNRKELVAVSLCLYFL